MNVKFVLNTRYRNHPRKIVSEYTIFTGGTAHIRVSPFRMKYSQSRKHHSSVYEEFLMTSTEKNEATVSAAERILLSAHKRNRKQSQRFSVNALLKRDSRVLNVAVCGLYRLD
ncbi:hypothetical protein KIN20_019561 [Parelaphostrongylus tenuis]|uniref:Uncharacterized protein n=1 Tax=Parelaphostrongylus tenuis TaxID=148309 RepID=A0AAD5QSH5_PARTN|nr:hypothetical protein KIN20_019561 [Parelaphostrongylus tenuis]